MKLFKSIKLFKLQLFKIFKREKRKEKKIYRRKVLKNFQFKEVGRVDKSIFERIEYIKKEKDKQDNLTECIDVQFFENPKESEEN